MPTRVPEIIPGSPHFNLEPVNAPASPILDFFVRALAASGDPYYARSLNFVREQMEDAKTRRLASFASLGGVSNQEEKDPNVRMAKAPYEVVRERGALGQILEKLGILGQAQPEPLTPEELSAYQLGTMRDLEVRNQAEQNEIMRMNASQRNALELLTTVLGLYGENAGPILEQAFPNIPLPKGIKTRFDLDREAQAEHYRLMENIARSRGDGTGPVDNSLALQRIQMAIAKEVEPYRIKYEAFLKAYMEALTSYPPLSPEDLKDLQTNTFNAENQYRKRLKELQQEYGVGDPSPISPPTPEDLEVPTPMPKVESPTSSGVKPPPPGFGPKKKS